MHHVCNIELTSRCRIFLSRSISWLTNRRSAPETLDMAPRAAYFHKPVDDQALVHAVAWALSKPPDNQPP